MQEHLLFSSFFSLVGRDPDGAKFDRLSRLVAVSKSKPKYELLLDINVTLFPIEEGDDFELSLVNSLTDDDGADVSEGYSYVMHGKIYRSEPVEGKFLAIYVSFGGLLMRIRGSAKELSSLHVDDYIYIMLKKI
eukprot:m.66675 g.66675  ORF g.66675 m.66675 type:complete len:134 (+) comp11823_c0_seq1:343-744(+)